MEEFEKELASLINRHSLENCSNTPDYVLAKYLVNCLEIWNKAVYSRDKSVGNIQKENPQLS